jgi:periplasmic protein TonB
VGPQTKNLMASYTTIRRQRAAIAAIVVAAHLVVAWLWMLIARAPSRPLDAAAQAVPIYARIIDRPRPEPLGTPAPVMVTLIPVTRPKLPTPVVQPIEVETLDSPAPGPDPAPSSAQLVTRPGPANGGGQGYPASMAVQQLKLVRRVAPIYSPLSGLAHEEGVTRMRALVDERGRVVKVELVGSSGYARLDDAAMKAVAKWRYEPPMRDGRAVSVWNPVNVTNVSVAQQKYCRIRDLPTANSTSEDVHDFTEVFLPQGGDAALRKLIEYLDSDNSQAREIRAQLHGWGPVQSVRHMGDGGIQGWVNREILPAFREGQPQSVVQVRSDIYMVRHERMFANWRVETDRAGEIWCVHLGPGHRIN